MISWVALKTTPNIVARFGPPPETDVPSRVEFHVLWRLTQNEHQAMLPYETVFVKRQGKQRPVARKLALFPRYVFAALENVQADYYRLRAAIPEIQGIVCQSRDVWSPLVLSPPQVQLVSDLVARTSKATEIDLHRSLRIGKAVEVSLGGTAQETKIDAITKKGVRVMLQMLGSMHSVEVPFDAVRAA